MPEAYAELVAHLRQPREALPRHAGHRVHHRAAASSACCRPAPASAPARRRCSIAVEMASEGADHAKTRRSCASTRRRSTSCCTRRIDPKARAQDHRHAACRPRPAPPSGEIVFTADEAESAQEAGEQASSWCATRPRPRTSTACTPREGILTARGGMTSHAAVVARGMGKPCVAGAGAIRVDDAAQHADASAGVTLQEGRHHHHRRLDRRGAAWARCRRSSRELSGEFAHADGLGRQGPHA